MKICCAASSETWANLNERGEKEIEYQSISFSAMAQHEFERFYNQCIDLVLYKYLKGIDK